MMIVVYTWYLIFMVYSSKFIYSHLQVTHFLKFYESIYIPKTTHMISVQHHTFSASKYTHIGTVTGALPCQGLALRWHSLGPSVYKVTSRFLTRLGKSSRASCSKNKASLIQVVKRKRTGDRHLLLSGRKKKQSKCIWVDVANSRVSCARSQFVLGILCVFTGRVMGGGSSRQLSPSFVGYNVDFTFHWEVGVILNMVHSRSVMTLTSIPPCFSFCLWCQFSL